MSGWARWTIGAHQRAGQSVILDQGPGSIAQTFTAPAGGMCQLSFSARQAPLVLNSGDESGLTPDPRSYLIANIGNTFISVQ